MTRIENKRTDELNDRELDQVSGGSDLLKYAIADGMRKGIAAAGGEPPHFSDALG